MEGCWALVCPKSFFDSFGYMYDGGLTGVLDMPEGFVEEGSCTFSYDGDADVARSLLSAMGMEEKLMIEDA
jgi:hypothetical protein